MMKLFPSRKEASKQMIQLPSKIHQFNTSYFWGMAGGRLTCDASPSPAHTAAGGAGLAAVTAPSKPQPICMVRASLLEAQNSVNVGREVLLH